jgi:hypothetical protein
MSMSSLAINLVPYVQNVVSDFIFLLLSFLLGWIVYRVTRRAPLCAFFQLKDTKRLVLYVSRLRIQVGGAIGIDDVPRSFGESAIPLYESNLIPIFQRLFNLIIPGVEALPGLLKRLLVSDVEVEIHCSPLSEGEVEREATFIAIGSGGYNIASRRIVSAFHPIGNLINDNGAIELPGMPPICDPSNALVQRVTDQATGQRAFWVAGISSLSTTGGALFLAKKWKYLANRYGDGRPFCVLVRIVSPDGHKYEILSERG